MLDEILDVFFDGGFEQSFCAGCGALREDGETGTADCDAMGDPSDGRCARHGDFREITEIAYGARREALCVAERRRVFAGAGTA
ncbi:MAG: hypothetical protein LBL73_08875 [Synergistaceae bacterium]|jgi:hypothetical protein|nr:hypothetical protein [Synergistaceae bacterium]